MSSVGPDIHPGGRPGYSISGIDLNDIFGPTHWFTYVALPFASAMSNEIFIFFVDIY